MYRENQLGLMVRGQPAEAARRIKAAIKTEGSVVAAAKALSCGLTSLKRWIARLEREGYLAEKKGEMSA